MDKTILLVDDEADDIDLTMRAFRLNDLAGDVVAVRDGSQALDYLFGTGAFGGRDTRRQPELVLLDLKMPGMDGLEVLRHIRADTRTKLLPVVVLTSSTEQVDLVQSYALGANSYVPKPVDFTQFIEATRQLGAYWLSLNRAPPP